MNRLKHFKDAWKQTFLVPIVIMPSLMVFNCLKARQKGDHDIAGKAMNTAGNIVSFATGSYCYRTRKDPVTKGIVSGLATACFATGIADIAGFVEPQNTIVAFEKMAIACAGGYAARLALRPQEKQPA